MRAQALDRALPAIAGFITDRTGIPIVRSERASTDNVAIYLPRRRSEIDLTERDLVEAVAFLYHEAGHMLHSNFALAAKTPLERAITSVLEDIRIEHLVMGKFPAARRYLSRLVGYLVEDGKNGSGFPALEGSEPESKILQYYMLYRLRRDVLRQDTIAEVCETAVTAAQMRFPSGMMTRLDALMFEVLSCESEDDVFALSAEIVEMIKEEKEKEEQKKQQAQEQQEQEAGQQQGQQSASSEDGDEQQGEGSQQQGTDQDGGEDSASGQASSSQGEASDDQSAQMSSGSAGGGAGGDHAQSLEQLLGMSDADVQEDLGEMLQNALNAAANAEIGEAGFVDVPMPNVHKARLRDTGVDVGALRASINATRTRTLQWMSSMAEGDISHSRSGMQIDSSRIWSARFGGSIFIREDEGIDLNAAVSIVIDRSGSMSQTIGHAVQAAVATMLAFDVPGLKTQVSVFPWYQAGDEGVAVVKRWEESPRTLAARIASLTTDGGTPMAEAILFAASDVIRREETLKIVLVVTDGDPNDMGATRYIIDRARADGITVVGLGIGVETAPVFGERYASTIRNIGELSASMVRLVKAAFEDNRRNQ